MKKIPLAGVVGSPIAHSKSPRLHNYWLSKHGIKGHYVPLHVDAQNLAEAIRTLPKLGFVGCNVTIPHKENIMDLADVVTDRARKIGAANALTFDSNGQIQADNTDAYGFIENIRQQVPGWSPQGKSVTVLGAGGAARAVVVALQEYGATDIRLTNRTLGRAQHLADAIGGGISVVDWADAPDLMAKTDVLVNTTSLGMAGNAPLELPLSGLSRDALVTDIVYAPLQTDLLRRAAQHGCRTVDGLGMLLHQGVPAFARWFGVTPVVDDDLRRFVLDV